MVARWGKSRSCGSSKNGPDAAPPRAQIREKQLFPNADGFHIKTVHTEAVNGRSRKAPWSGETQSFLWQNIQEVSGSPSKKLDGVGGLCGAISRTEPRK